jgi:hypothetical protein
LQKPICAPLVPMVLPFPTQNALALLNYISSYFVFSSHFLFPTNPISSIHIQFIKFILKCCYHSKTWQIQFFLEHHCSWPWLISPS